MADIAKKLGDYTSAIAEAIRKKEGEDQRCYFSTTSPNPLRSGPPADSPGSRSIPAGTGGIVEDALEKEQAMSMARCTHAAGVSKDQQKGPMATAARSSVAQLARQRPRIMCSELLGRSQK